MNRLKEVLDVVEIQSSKIDTKTIQHLRMLVPLPEGLSDSDALRYMQKDLEIDLANLLASERMKLQGNTADTALCHCRDRQGEFKILYADKFSAKQALISRKEKTAEYLHIYPCPSTRGWHLSKR